MALEEQRVIEGSDEVERKRRVEREESGREE
jgi:hypothetical protein